MAANLDTRVIATFSSLPETTINAVIDSPTQELVRSLLQTIETKAKEFEQYKSQKVKLEVELETHVRTSESKAKVLSNSRDKALADVSKLRIDLQNAESARLKMESELEQARNSSNSEATELNTLQTRIQSVEASSRDTLGLLESKTSAYDRLAQELSSQHQKIVDLRKQVSTLEQANQTANSAVASAKFREQNLQQELDLQKKNNDWLENERKTKSEEHTSFRKEKNARISELTQSNERYIEEAESARRAEMALKLRLDEHISRNEGLLQQIQTLKEQEIANAENQRIQLDSTSRLAELQKQSADTAKQRVQELSNALDEVREEASDEIGRIRAEVESEHQDREAAEQKVVELEARVAQLEQDLDNTRVQPSTPRRDVNGNGLSTPLRPETPIGIFTPASANRMKGNLTVTQLYGEYKKLEKELASERRLNEQLQNNVDSMLEDLEANRPEIEELRLEQGRLQNEIVEMSTAAEHVNHERDTAIKESRIVQGKLEAVSKELEVCQQSLRDRNSQIRWLLLDREARADGDQISEDQYKEMEQAAAQVDERDSAHLSDSQRVVNQRLVLFRNITVLQEQNENQLATIRNLVERLDSTEAQEIQQENARLKTELESTQQQVIKYQDEIKSMVSQSKSFVQERDMFRRMLSRKGQLPTNVDPADFSRSLPLPSAGSPTRLLEEASNAGGDNDYARLLKDLQSHFDNYKQESATDNSSLRSQINDLSKRNSNLQMETSKVTSQLSAANQRCEMLQANYDMLKNETQEIKKRSDIAIETAARQESRVQQAAEELVEARGLVESLRRESANLKAEKDLWKTVETRMRDDNESLRNDRARSEQLNSSLQNLLNEREQSDSETRRRLRLQVETLESELQTSKRKLSEELEDSKKTALRREYEHGQSQKRIDDLFTSLSNVREELATVKTTRDHLQARVDELTVELRSAEERLEVFTRPVVESEGQTNGMTEDSLTREQELTVEVSELKRDLDLRSTELERANEQVEVYKGIAQSAEERLQELSETNEQYREETEAVLSEKDEKIKNLEQRVEDISSELNTTNNELSSLRNEHGETTRRLDEQRSGLEAEIAHLKDSEERSAEQAQFNLEASKAQAEIANEAQQNYENELVKHAEAAKNLHAIRAEANQLKLELVEVNTQAATARLDLEQKEASWLELKDRYERELSDLKKRREEIAQQNTLLHGQLESLTQQTNALQRDRAALTEISSSEQPTEDSKARTDLQEVISYLRREKEIIEVQYHLSSQEQKRLRQQVDFLQSQLDDTRLKLEQQRRAEVDSERNVMSHNKLMETLNELNLFRESSVTLRAEAKQANLSLAEKTSKVQELEERIQPLQARIAELENLSELREGEMKLLQEDRDHWQQRCQNILSKYDRVDPAELESLKTRLSELENERDEAVALQSELRSQIESHPEAIEAAKADLRNRLSEQFKGRSKEQSLRIKEKQTELDAANNEMIKLQDELNSTKEQLAVARKPGAGTPIQNGDPNATSAHTQNENGGSEARLAELEGKVDELQASLTAKEQEIASVRTANDEKFKARENQLKEMLNKRLSEVKQQLNAASQAQLDEQHKKLTAEHEQELEKLRAQSVPVAAELQQAANDISATTTRQSALTFESLVENLTEAQARQLVQTNETIKNILRNNIRKARESLRQELSASQPAGEQQNTASGSAPTSTEDVMKQFEQEKDVLVKQKEAEFATEKQAMVQEFEQKLEAEKQAIVAQKDKDFANEKLEFSKESEKKIAEQIANAQALTEKRGAVKFNMADNRAKSAQAKLDVVKRAAEETPEKPVKEVWDVAKDAKPVPQQPVKAAVPSSLNVKASEPAAIQSAPVTQNAASGAASAEATSTQLTAVKDAAPADIKQDEAVHSTMPELPNKPPQPVNTGTGPGAIRQLQTGLPQLRGGSHRGGRGGSAIPQPATNNQQQGQPARGSGIPRGGGRAGSRAGGRAGTTNVQTSITGAPNRGGGANSPSRGALNPNAQQFTPGGAQKRAREDSEGDASVGKRIRGGGNGA